MYHVMFSQRVYHTLREPTEARPEGTPYCGVWMGEGVYPHIATEDLPAKAHECRKCTKEQEWEKYKQAYADYQRLTGEKESSFPVSTMEAALNAVRSVFEEPGKDIVSFKIARSFQKPGRNSPDSVEVGVWRYENHVASFDARQAAFPAETMADDVWVVTVTFRMTEALELHLKEVPYRYK